MARFLVPALAVGSCALLASGCGGGMPLLHGAHALSPGMTTAAAGFSGVFTTGSLREAVEAARKLDPSGVGSGAADQHGPVVYAMGPGVAPFVGMRIGLNGDNEVGLAYNARTLRLDARHAFENGPWALSLGAGVLGASGPFNVSDTSGGETVSARPPSLGLDVPVLFGWRSDAGVVSLWAGARGGAEQIGRSDDCDLFHWQVGALAGLAMGFRHVHVALALETSYQGVKGKYRSAKVEMHGLTLTPAGGLLFTF